MRLNGTWAILLCWLTLGCALERDAPEADLSIRAPRIVLGTGEVVEEGVVRIVAGRIVQVLAVSEEDEPEGIDITLDAESTLIPGLIETHAHLLAHPSFVRDSDRAMDTFRSAILPGLLEAYLSSGFTTVLDNGSPWPIIREVRDQVERRDLRGPRILTLGPVLTAPDGHPAANIYGSNTWGRELGTRELDDAAEARDVVDALIEGGVDGIKVVYDGNPQPRLQLEILAAITAQASVAGVPVYVHAGTAEEAAAALDVGALRLVHTPSESSIQDTRLVQILSGSDVQVSVTLGGSSPEGHFTVDSEGVSGPGFDTTLANVRLLVDSGIGLAYGTDNTNVLLPAQVLEVEIDVLQDAGLTSEAILIALTRDAARYLRKDSELGTIELGKQADLIAVRGDPLEDLSALERVELVIQGGDVVVDRR